MVPVMRYLQREAVGRTLDGRVGLIRAVAPQRKRVCCFVLR